MVRSRGRKSEVSWAAGTPLDVRYGEDAAARYPGGARAVVTKQQDYGEDAVAPGLRRGRRSTRIRSGAVSASIWCEVVPGFDLVRSRPRLRSGAKPSSASIWCEVVPGFDLVRTRPRLRFGAKPSSASIWCEVVPGFNLVRSRPRLRFGAKPSSASIWCELVPGFDLERTRLGSAGDARRGRVLRRFP
jgi:hypothetical protein